MKCILTKLEASPDHGDLRSTRQRHLPDDCSNRHSATPKGSNERVIGHELGNGYTLSAICHTIQGGSGQIEARTLQPKNCSEICATELLLANERNNAKTGKKGDQKGSSKGNCETVPPLSLLQVALHVPVDDRDDLCKTI
jgi:hypothetical protein